MDHGTRDETPNAIRKVLDRFEEWACRPERERMNREHLGLFARDLGLEGSDVTRLATGTINTPRLLDARLKNMGLSKSEIASAGIASSADMELACRNCATRARCEQDLERQPEATDWQRDCPNAWVFDAMGRLKKVQA